MTPRLAALHAVMRDFEPDAITTPDIWSYLWGKLGYGAMLFAQALGQKGIADCLARPELLPLWRRLGEEAIVVAQAEGVAAARLQRLRHRGVQAWRQRGGGTRRASPRWWRSTAPARRRIPASGATLRFASAAPRWMCRSPRSPRSARATASTAAPRASWWTMIHEVEDGTPADDRRQPAGTGEGELMMPFTVTAGSHIAPPWPGVARSPAAWYAARRRRWPGHAWP